ncbi:MAG: glycosyltransferase family 2 protein [Ignavibacteria bacterium]|nr:glycosyltransferase family 2 protein [Ignavibacteria bacterium]MCU7519716.1 glycosyltransferase family 2 protein [Ignavibacteria bacterium]
MPELTLSMIVKNEEKYLQGCLESVKGIADEIVVVDTGSTDATVEIAKSYGAKVLHFNWINDFAAARNFALKNSSGRWILYLDADERLSEKSIPLLRKVIKQNSKTGYNCIVNSPDPITGKPNYMRYQRLFLNNPRIEFRGTIHEQIVKSLIEEKYKIANSDIEILHLGYNISKDALKVKAQRNLEYLLKEIQSNSTAYNNFQLAQTYAVLDDKESAVEYFRRTLACSDATYFMKSHACRFIASYLSERDRLKEALDYGLQGLKYDSRQPLLNMVLAKILLKMGDSMNALKFCRSSLEANRMPKSKDYEIYVNDKLIIYLGLKASVIADNKAEFNYYFNELYKADSNEAGSNDFLNAVKALFLSEEINDSLLGKIGKITDENSFELVIALIDKYMLRKNKFQLLEAIPSNLRNSFHYLNSLGLAYFENGMEKEALNAYEMSLTYAIKDPASVFFMISMYVNSGDFIKTDKLLCQAENSFAYLPEVAAKLKMVKKQIQEFIK